MVEHSDKEQAVFMAALEIENPSERSAYLAQACEGDEALAERIKKLLGLHDDGGDFMRGNRSNPNEVAPASEESPDTRIIARVAEELGSVIGRYKLLQKIGEGGFGVVYMAAQREPIRRRVALKIIKLGMDTKQVVARFEAERQALAMMDHPNIAKVLDGGETEHGRPYFVMELVRGIPVLEFCDENRLSTRQRLKLFIQACEAVHHAHQKGIIHRDIKPSNILVTMHDNVFSPKVIDFGIAKATQQELTEKTIFTRYHEFMGTPAYMSPEQAQFSGLDIDTRTDIYSLGVLLYALLTGRTPFGTHQLMSGGYDAMRKMILEKEPPKPSTQLSTLSTDDLKSAAEKRRSEPGRLWQSLRGDLDWIVLKALEKDRTRRYESALSLAADVENYLNDEPVTAVAPSVRYRFRKFARRNRFALSASILVAGSLIGGLVVSSVMAYRAVNAEQQAREALSKELDAKVEAQAAERIAREAQQKARDEAAVAAAVNRFLNEDLIGYANPLNEPDRNVRLSTLLERASNRIEERFEEQPLAEAAIRHTLSLAYLNLGNYQVAEVHAERAASLREAALAQDNEGLLQSQVLLAATRVQAGRYREVILDLEQLLDVARSRFTPRHELTIEAAYWLSKAYAQVARPDQGEQLMVEFLPISQSALPMNHWLRPTIVNERCYYHVAYRRMPEAEAFAKEWLARYRGEFGREHPYPIMIMHHLATSLLTQGKYAECRDVYEEALALQAQVLGEEHPGRIKTMAEYSWYYRYTGQFEPAERFLEESFEMAQRVLGLPHPLTRKISSWLSGLYTREDQVAKRRALLVDLLSKDPENPHALEHLAGFLDVAKLTPLASDSEQAPHQWRYTLTEPSGNWAEERFDDTDWQLGGAPFGNGASPECHTKWDTRAIWLRREFTLDSMPKGRLVLRLLQDDHSEIYINGRLALMRQGWSGRKWLLIYALNEAVRGLRTGRNVIAVRTDNIDLEGVIDLGVYVEPTTGDDDNPVPLIW